MPNSQPSIPRGISGAQVLSSPVFNKDLAFSIEERIRLKIHGLLPPAVNSASFQQIRVLDALRSKSSDLERFIYLMSLQNRNETLFYEVLINNLAEITPLVYTPTVGEACQKYSSIIRQPRGIFITIKDLGYVEEILKNWPVNDVRAIVFTDGERILGLGDLGCNGMGIPVGKMALYTACAGVPPSQCLPVMIDVGTNNETLLADPLYIGLRQKRDRSAAYDQLIDEFMHAVVRRFGPSTLIQFEDFGNSNAFRLLEKYRHSFLTFNDDIQGTASVALAGLLSGVKVTNKPLKDHVVLFFGAGEAATGMADLLSAAIREETSCTEEESRKNIWLIDSRGLVVKSRSEELKSTPHKLIYAKDTPALSDNEAIVDLVRPSAIIGASAQPGLFNESILKKVASFNETPIIFALSNPTSKAECTAEQAYKTTHGKCIFASGSPFDPVVINDKTLVPGQGNNAYIFPGVALGVIAVKAVNVPDVLFLRAAQALASVVTEAHLESGCIYPPFQSIREVSVIIATAVAKCCYELGIATILPQPADLEAHIRQQVYVPEYAQFSTELEDAVVERFSHFEEL